MKKNLIGNRIRQIRTLNEWTQPQLAEQCQLHGLPYSRETIAKFENGIRKIHDYEIVDFAKVLNCSILDLFDVPEVDTELMEARKFS